MHTGAFTGAPCGVLSRYRLVHERVGKSEVQYRGYRKEASGQGGAGMP